jgi:hypothetical protein
VSGISRNKLSQFELISQSSHFIDDLASLTSVQHRGHCTCQPEQTNNRIDRAVRRPPASPHFLFPDRTVRRLSTNLTDNERMLAWFCKNS